MKIGIYSICKNEEANLEGWWENVKDADYVHVLDTGSTDLTVKKLQVMGEYPQFTCHTQPPYIPFAFDDARNTALQHLSAVMKEDGCGGEVCYAVWVDFDEKFEEGWLAKLRAYITQCTLSGNFPSSIHFNNTFEGSGYNWFQARVHRLEEYFWQYSAHEVLMYSNKGRPETIAKFDITITHPNKEERNDYTDLLIKSHEKFADGRSSYYLGREYWYNGDLENASKYLRECLFVQNGWQAERGEAANILADIHKTLDPASVLKYLYFYVAYCNLQREPYMELAKYFYDQKDWDSVIYYSKLALEIERPVDNYLSIRDEYYGVLPYDYLCFAYDQLDDKNQAAVYAATCLSMDVNNERYRRNVQYYIELGVLKIEQDSTEASTGNS